MKRMVIIDMNPDVLAREKLSKRTDPARDLGINNN